MATSTISQRWSVADALELYNIRAWSAQYFTINEQGNLAVQDSGASAPAVDLKDLVDEVRQRGIALPLLIRFPHILQGRVVELNEAFQRAIAEYGYKASYRGVYPIKVNQDRYVVEQLVEAGAPYHFGLEAGSKPELLAVMAMLEDDEALIVCNGYKDEEYIETALLASKLGRIVVLVVEKPAELKLIAELAQKTGVRPRIGIRARLASRGSGHWEASGGDRSKFGLGARDLVEAIEFLQAERPARLPRAAPLPSRQPDLLHPPRQERPARGRPHLRRAVQAGGAARVPRRRRRAGRRLRRLADQLLLVDELHAPGVRQRHRLRHHGAVRRRGRAASDDRLRIGPRRGRAPRGAGGRRARRR